MRGIRIGSLASLAAAPVVLLVLASAACGGAKPATDAPKTPENAVEPAPTAAPVSSSATTTTMTLGDGGDLQGTKLATSTTTTQTNVPVGDAGAPSTGPHTPEPGRSVKDVQAIIMAHRDEARACYDKSLKDHPGIEGNIDIKWTIDPKGAVTEIAVDEGKSDIHEPGVGRCIMDIIQKIHFSVSGKGFETRAHYPFNFHPRNAPPQNRAQ